MSQPWIGLLELRKLPGWEIMETPGAFVNLITVAISDRESQDKVLGDVKKACSFLNEIEDLEPFAERVSKYEVDDELMELSARAESPSDEVRFGTFHAYPRTGRKLRVFPDWEKIA
jgi:hypothetical protein